MEGPRTPPRPPVRPKGKSPAERSEEFTATQQRLKEEAAARRTEAVRAAEDRKS
jgi:hypothetical protein